jgi:hypothetical protein
MVLAAITSAGWIEHSHPSVNLTGNPFPIVTIMPPKMMCVRMRIPTA